MEASAIILYVLKRAFLLIPLLLGITLLTFALTKALPGDPVQGMVGERAKPETIESIREQIGADKSLPRQYLGYITLLANGEFGRSYYTNRDVFEDIQEKFPNTLALAIGAMVLATPFGVGIGLLAAYRRGSRLDRFVTTLSVLGISMPVFWTGLLLMLLLSFTLKLVPPSGTGGLRYMVLPVITLALPAMAGLARVSRTAVLDVIEMPYVQVAAAKGLTQMRINMVHVLRNALIPIVTVIGLDFGSYLNGAVLTETIFGWDGLGRYAMEGIIRRDYPVVMGSIVVGTTVFVFINMLVDLTYQRLDPRVRLGPGAGTK